MAMLRVAGGVFLFALLFMCAWPCSATEFSWTGALQLDERSGAVALEAGRVSKVVGSEACALAEQTNVAVTLETSAPGAKQQAESSAGDVLTGSVTDACGGAALVTLGLLKVDKTGAVATWIGTASWAGVRCKNASAGLSVRVSLSAPSVLKSVTLIKCAISTVCASSAANSIETFTAQKSEADGVATNALAHHSRARREVCGGTVSTQLTATPYVFGSNLYQNYFLPNMACTWYLCAPKGAVVYLKITALETEACCDIIFVHNGDVNDPLFPGGEFGGDVIPGPFMSSGYLIRTDFQSGDSAGGTGFIAEATSRFICNQGQSVNVTVNNTIVATGAPGNNYTANAQCSWTLTAAEGKRAKISFKFFTTRQTQDTLSVYDGADGDVLFGVFSGPTVPEPIVATGSSLRLVFASQQNAGNPGFELLFTFTDDAPTPLSPCMSLPPAVAHGNVTNCPGTLSGALCIPKCDQGYAPLDAYSCYGSLWSGDASCPASPCFTAPSVDHGEAQHCAGLPNGQTCTFNCDTGYTRNGNLTCSFGTWAGNATCDGTASHTSANCNDWGICSAMLWLVVALSVLVLGVLIFVIIRRFRNSRKGLSSLQADENDDDDDELLRSVN